MGLNIVTSIYLKETFSLIQSLWIVEVVDVRGLRDDDSNSLGDYQRYIDLTTKQSKKSMEKLSYVAVIGISRSNAIALGVLVKYYGMTFGQAQETIKQKVKRSDIKELHISKLKELLKKE